MKFTQIQNFGISFDNISICRGHLNGEWGILKVPKYVEEASGGGDREDWFEEGGCSLDEQSGETECEQLQKEWGESGHLC